MGAHLWYLVQVDGGVQREEVVENNPNWSATKFVVGWWMELVKRWLCTMWRPSCSLSRFMGDSAIVNYRFFTGKLSVSLTSGIPNWNLERWWIARLLGSELYFVVTWYYWRMCEVHSSIVDGWVGIYLMGNSFYGENYKLPINILIHLQI